MPLLTRALEFVFGCSDLVASGWSPERWAGMPYSDGHLFTRSRIGYKDTVAAFKAAMAASPSNS